jgi:hypothetical protein
MSVAKYACSTPNKKLFFGKPNPLILIEDLAYRLTLKELEDIMGDVMQTYYDEGLEKNAPPAEHPIDIHNNLVQIAMKNYTDKLYGNQITYSASILRKCAKLYKETTITIDNHLVHALKKQALNPETNEIDQIFNRDFSENMDYDQTVKKLAILSHIYNREV